MDNRAFDALVRRLEPQAAANPAGYKLRVLLLALLGYAYIGVVLALLLGAVAACVWLMLHVRGGNAALVKLAFPLLMLAGVVARALWVRIPPPEGRRLAPHEAPKLFEEAERLRKALGAPRADVVLLNDEYNASVSQVPRFGIFGFPRNYLVVGLPLLQALPADRVRAVLAHEFAHLSHAHGKFGAWIYRVRVTWFQLMERLDAEQHRGAFVFRRFFRWYAPYFGAYSFVLARQHEYEADRLAATVVGKSLMAQTLVDLEVRGELLSRRFWPAVWEEAETSPVPPPDVYARLAATARDPLPDADAREWLVAALKRRTDTADTHPSLRDRVTALVGAPDATLRLPGGAPLRAAATFVAPAAEHYLGAAHALLATELGTDWRAAAQQAWTNRREGMQAARAALAALDAKAATGPLDDDERWQRASLTEDVHGADAALPLYQALLDDRPEHLPAAFAVGRLLLARGDERGIALVERVMERDEEAVLPGCRVVYGFLAREGRLEEADGYRERAGARAAVLEKAQREREVITAKDRYLPPELPAEQVAAIVAQLEGHPDVKRAYLARKVVRHAAGAPAPHVLAVVSTSGFLKHWSERALEEAITRVVEQLDLPPDVYAYAITPRNAHLVKPMRKVKGAAIYAAGRMAAA